MRLLGGLACLLIGCSAPRDDAGDRHVVDAVVAQLAPVMRVEPAGALAVVATPSGTTLSRGDARLTIAAMDVDERAVARVDERTSLLRSPGLDVVRIASTGRFEELRRVHAGADRIELRYRITLEGALAALSAKGAYVEALDRNGVARLRTEPAFAIDKNGVTRALDVAVEGTTIRWTLDARGLAAPIAIDPAWTTTASMATSRSGADAFTLPGGKVAVMGGQGGPTSIEIYDNATASFTSGPSLTRSRSNIRPTKLTDGRIMIAGGEPAIEDPVTADIYDPAAGTVTKTSGMPIRLYVATAAALPGGNAMVSARAGALVWNASSNTWTNVGNLATPRNRHYAFTLSSGKVVLLGGRDLVGPLSTVEQFDPSTKTFSALPSMSRVRIGFGIAQFGDKLYVTGGTDNSDAGLLYSSTEVYDGVAKTWTAGPDLATARWIHGSAAMSDGRLLIAAGQGETAMLVSAEILDFAAKTTTPAGALAKVRAQFPLVPIVAGENRFLAIGGYNGAGTAAVELFSPAPLGAKCTGTGECAMGTCVDGVCCEKAACATGETCGGPGAPGLCRAINGKTCTSADQCASGQCVDGVCCNGACTGVCQACDLAATVGTCATLSPGDSPHGARAKCPGSGTCQGVCGGVEADKCTVFPGAATACGEGSCGGGEETAAASCDGAGNCAAPPKNKCEPFACGDVSCKRACAVDGDCATGYSCDARTGRCVFGAKCDGDHTVAVPSAASIDCTPYRCAGSSCLERCSATSDCVAGTACDTASSKCVPAPAAAADEGGCAMGHGSGPPIWIALLFVVAMRRRVR